MLIVSILITNDCSLNGGNKLAADLRIELAKLGLGEPSKQKMSRTVEKVYSAKIKIIYISNVDFFETWGGGLNFSHFSQIQITEIWP